MDPRQSSSGQVRWGHWACPWRVSMAHLEVVDAGAQRRLIRELYGRQDLAKHLLGAHQRRLDLTKVTEARHRPSRVAHQLATAGTCVVLNGTQRPTLTCTRRKQRGH